MRSAASSCGDLELDLGADRHGTCGGAGHEGIEAGDVHGIVSTREIAFVEIEHEQERLGRQQLKTTQTARVVRRQAKRAQRLPGFERSPAADEDVALFAQFRIQTLLDVALEPFEAAFDDAKIGEDDLVFHGTNVACRIDRSRRVRHGGIAKHPHDVQQRVGVPERRQIEHRLRAGLRAARAGNVRELHRRRHVLFRIEECCQTIEPLVGHAGHANVRFGLAALPGRFAGARQQLKERRFS